MLEPAAGKMGIGGGKGIDTQFTAAAPGIGDRVADAAFGDLTALDKAVPGVDGFLTVIQNFFNWQWDHDLSEPYYKGRNRDCQENQTKNVARLYESVAFLY